MSLFFGGGGLGGALNGLAHTLYDNVCDDFLVSGRRNKLVTLFFGSGGGRGGALNGRKSLVVGGVAFSMVQPTLSLKFPYQEWRAVLGNWTGGTCLYYLDKPTPVTRYG